MSNLFDFIANVAAMTCEGPDSFVFDDGARVAELHVLSSATIPGMHDVSVYSEMRQLRVVRPTSTDLPRFGLMPDATLIDSMLVTVVI
jgi:hypothetical protein